MAHVDLCMTVRREREACQVLHDQVGRLVAISFPHLQSALLVTLAQCRLELQVQREGLVWPPWPATGQGHIPNHGTWCTPLKKNVNVFFLFFLILAMLARILDSA